MYIRSLTLCLLLALTGCGRITTQAPTAVTPIGTTEAPAESGPRLGLAADLASAEAAARPYLGRGFDGTLAQASIGPLHEDGTPFSGPVASWELGFWVQDGTALGLRVVRLDERGQGRMNSAFGSLEAAPLPLKPASLPSAGTAIAKALAAGLPAGSAYEVDYLATPSGPRLKVTSRQKDKTNKQITLDAQTFASAGAMKLVAAKHWR